MAERAVDPAEFRTLGRSTPFEGMRLTGEAVMTMVAGKVVFQKEGFQW